jgi:hypothetical protein
MYVPVRRQLVAEDVASILTPSSLNNYCGCNVILYHLYQYVEWQLTYSMYYNLAVPDSKSSRSRLRRNREWRRPIHTTSRSLDAYAFCLTKTAFVDNLHM